VARARLNKVKQILRRHNLQWGLPTKTFPTVAAVTWLKGLALPEIDRLEQVIARRSAANKEVVVPSSMPGGRVERFPRAHSLANYWGLTPGCRNRGERDQPLRRITKAGSSTARWLLAQLVHKVLRRDVMAHVRGGWYDDSLNHKH
jgi:transposase